MPSKQGAQVKRALKDASGGSCIRCVRKKRRGIIGKSEENTEIVDLSLSHSHDQLFNTAPGVRPDEFCRRPAAEKFLGNSLSFRRTVEKDKTNGDSRIYNSAHLSARLSFISPFFTSSHVVCVPTAFTGRLYRLAFFQSSSIYLRTSIILIQPCLASNATVISWMRPLTPLMKVGLIARFNHVPC